MSFVVDFNSSWYILFTAFLVSWAVLLFVRRKRQGKKEVVEQVFLALSGMFALALMEFFAVSMNLWHYTPGNWPVILWPTYFAAILFGYQLLKSIEGLLHGPGLRREFRSAYSEEAPVNESSLD
jgi:RsiW-degrading membrane proteinase PrsW (M82 family)